MTATEVAIPKIISVDDHVVEPPDMFKNHLPAKWQEYAPKSVKKPDGIDVWVYEDNVIPNIGLNAVAGRPPEEYNIEPTSYDMMRKGCYDIHERVNDMNRNGVLAERRAHPANDLMSILAASELDGQHLTDEEIFAFLRLLLPAGAETTYRSSSNLLFGLLTHPDQLDALRADRALMPKAIEEGLRWEPPLTTIVRTATRDTVVDGVDVPAGAVVITNMGSANHDEKYWERSEEFDIHREQRQHLAFAFGPHMCLGMHLARMETRVVLERIFERLPNVRLDPAADAPQITGMTFRAPPALPVLFG